MHFSISCGLPFMALLLFLPAQGQRQCTTPALMTRPTILHSPSIYSTCCLKVSTDRVGRTINACYEQRDNSAECKIHSYIFVYENKQCHCVDPNASWLPECLQKLEERGITCQPLPRNLSCEDDEQ